jgi:hypothetical protein
VKEQDVITESHGTTPAPVFGRNGEPCPSCGAPLAGDQRYCLHCGARRPEARLEFLDVLDADVRARQAGAFGGPPAAGVVTTTTTGPAPVGGVGRLNAHAGVLAVAALSVLTLLVGLLIGHWVTERDATTSTNNAAAPAPQVIRVEGTAAPSATGATATTPDASDTSATKAKAKAKSADAGDKAKAPKGAVSVKSLSSKKAVDDAIKKGKPISTGEGKLPPKDDKAPGGGSDFEEIG